MYTQLSYTENGFYRKGTKTNMCVQKGHGRQDEDTI